MISSKDSATLNKRKKMNDQTKLILKKDEDLVEAKTESLKGSINDPILKKYSWLQWDPQVHVYQCKDCYKAGGSSKWAKGKEKSNQTEQMSI
jgi:hypothetical protein